MVKSDTVRTMTDSQKNEIVETMIGAMPSLNFFQAQAVIGTKSTFVSFISAAFEPYLGLNPTAKKTDPTLPTKFTIADRVYELVPFLKEGESSVTGDTMVERAHELNANLGKEDGALILKHQDEIPPEFRRKICLVFMAWRDPSNPRNVAFLRWCNDHWYPNWRWLAIDWGRGDRLVRSHPSTRA